MKRIDVLRAAKEGLEKSRGFSTNIAEILFTEFEREENNSIIHKILEIEEVLSSAIQGLNAMIIVENPENISVVEDKEMIDMLNAILNF